MKPRPSTKNGRSSTRPRVTATPSPDAAIDFSTILDATPEQLARVRRILIGPRKAISIKVDPEVLRELRAEATRRGTGYQTLMNDVLAGAVLHFRQQRKGGRS